MSHDHAQTILRAAREMKKRATAHKKSGEPTPLNPDAVIEIARFMEACGRDLNVSGRYARTDEPGAVESAHDIARAYFSQETAS
jgi:hypothetical protein